MTLYPLLQAAAETAAHKHHWFEFAEIALHIAIVLCSLVLLTNITLFFRAGIAATVVGIGLAVFAQLSHHHAPAPTPAPANPPPAAAPAKGH